MIYSLLLIAILFGVVACAKAKENGYDPRRWAAVSCFSFIGVFAFVSFLIGVVIGFLESPGNLLSDWRLIGVFPMFVSVVATWVILRPIYRLKEPRQVGLDGAE